MLIKKKKGLIIVLSSPSGAGKTTLAKKLLLELPNLKLSVSLTTRSPRNTEVNQIDYQFVNLNFFKKKIKKKLFLEYAKVFDNYYGTLRSQVLKKINNGQSVLLDIDWQGARQVKKLMPNDVLSIFILPPSIKELENRLKKRKHENNFVQKRMSKAKQEIMHWKEYDYAVVNDDLNKCLKIIKQIIIFEKYKSMRQSIKKF